MSCCSKEEQMTRNNEVGNLRRQIQQLQDTIHQKVQIINRQQQEISKLNNQLALEKKRMIAESIQQMSKVREQLSQANNLISELQTKENRLKDEYQKDISNNLRTIKNLQQQLMSSNDLNKLQELQKKNQVNLLITFKSLQDLYLNKDNRYGSLDYGKLEISFKSIYLLYSISLYQEKKIILCTDFYVDFLQRVIQNGYDQSSDDRRMREARETMQAVAVELYKKFQEVIRIAKLKFTKERSRILDEQEVDNSHEELKLREKIDSLQKVIQSKDLLIKELQGYRSTNQMYEKSTIPSLREQINKKEAPQIKEVKTMMIEMKNTMLQISECVGLQQKKQGEASSQYDELVELMKGKDLKIQELQQKVFQLEKHKSELSEETLSQSKRITNESMEKDKDIEILRGKLEASQEEINRMKRENDQYVQRLSSLRRQLTDKEETFSKLNQQIDSLRKDNAELVKKNKELNEKKEAETKKLQELTSKLTFTTLTLEQSSKKIQALENKLQSMKKEQLNYSEKEVLSSTLQSSLQQSSREQEELTRQLEKLNARVNELNRLLKEKEAEMVEQSLKKSEAELRADSAENKQNELEEKLEKEVKQHKKTKDALNEVNRSLEDVTDQKDKIQQQLQQIKKNPVVIIQPPKEKEQKDNLIKQRKLIEQLQQQKELAKTLQQKLDNLAKTATNGRFRSASFVQHRTLFIGEILQKRKPEKKYLMDSIESHMKQDIEKTNKLYEYKRDHKTNFHQFIDGHSNIVLIIQTENALLACYYSGQLLTETTSVMDEQALIVSLDNRKVYKLNNSYNYPNRDPKDTRIMRGMVYDPYYLIFGNAEVRIRSGEKKVFCNFGINNGYFNSERDRAAELLMVKNKNQVEFINYEIHEIFFNEEYILQRVE